MYFHPTEALHARHCYVTVKFHQENLTIASWSPILAPVPFPALRAMLRIKLSIPTWVFIFACLAVAVAANGFFYRIFPFRGITVVQFVFTLFAHDPLDWIGGSSSLPFWAVRTVLFLSHNLLVVSAFALPAIIVLVCGKRFAPNWLTSTLLVAWCGFCLWAYFGTPLIDI